MMKKSKLFEIASQSEMQEFIASSETIGEVLTKCGLGNNRADYRNYHRLVALYNLEHISLLPPSVKKKERTLRLTDSEFFQNGIYRSGANLRKRLIRLGVEFTCSEFDCDLGGRTTWRGKPITFEVDHINGNALDNTVTNLRFLCKMCHAQTETYGNKNAVSYDTCECGLNKKAYLMKCPNCIPESKQPRKEEQARGENNNNCACGKTKLRYSKQCSSCYTSSQPTRIDWPSNEEISQLVEKYGYSALGKQLGITDNAIRKHLRNQGINPLPKRKPRNT